MTVQMRSHHRRPVSLCVPWMICRSMTTKRIVSRNFMARNGTVLALAGQERFSVAGPWGPWNASRSLGRAALRPERTPTDFLFLAALRSQRIDNKNIAFSDKDVCSFVPSGTRISWNVSETREQVPKCAIFLKGLFQ